MPPWSPLCKYLGRVQMDQGGPFLDFFFWGTFILISTVAELDCTPSIWLILCLIRFFIGMTRYVLVCVCAFPVWAPQVLVTLWLLPVLQDSAKTIAGSGYLWVLVDSFTFLCPLHFSKIKVLDRLTQWPPDRPCLLNFNPYLISKSLTCPVGHSSL